MPAVASSPWEIVQSRGASFNAASHDSIESINIRMIDPGNVIAPSRRTAAALSLAMRIPRASNLLGIGCMLLLPIALFFSTLSVAIQFGIERRKLAILSNQSAYSAQG